MITRITAHSVPRRTLISRRVLAALAGLVVIALVTTACTSAKPKASPSTTAGIATTAPTAPAAAGSSSPGTFAVRPAAWTPCPNVPVQQTGLPNTNFTWDCATIQVPQDWHNPNNGQTFDIAMVRARSKTQHDRIGSLIINPGGPGGSGIQFAAGELSSAEHFPTAVSDRFDIVGFDPRGVGESTEVKCLTSTNEDALIGADPDPSTQAEFDAVVQLNKQAESPCGAKYGNKLPLFSTEQAARDIDAIRQAVGDAKTTYLGFSYGTLLGAVYAQLFPQNLRAAVLDGAVDPTQDLVARSENQAAGFEHAFDDFATWCKANASKCPIADNPRAEVTAALDNARKDPVPGSDGRKATAGWIFTAVGAAMYTEQFWPILGQAINNLKTKNAALTFELADEYAERGPGGQYTNLFDDNDAVNCADFAHQPTVAQIRTYQEQWRTKYPLFGAALATGLISCAQGVWPGSYSPFPVGPAKGAPPIVVVGTTGDPATPYAQTAKLADSLGVGHVITWEGEGHTAYPQTTCITNAVNAYLINLTLPQQGLTCPAKS